jgi:hypothetical protein
MMLAAGCVVVLVVSGCTNATKSEGTRTPAAAPGCTKRRQEVPS